MPEKIDLLKLSDQELIDYLRHDNVEIREQVMAELTRRALSSPSLVERLLAVAATETDAEASARLNHILNRTCTYVVRILSVEMETEDWKDPRPIEFRFGTDKSHIEVNTPSFPIRGRHTTDLGPVGIQIFNSRQHEKYTECRSEVTHPLFINAVDCGELSTHITFRCDGRKIVEIIAVGITWSKGLASRGSSLRFRVEVETKCGL